MDFKHRLPGLGLVSRHRAIKVFLEIWGTRRFLATLQFHSFVVHFIGLFLAGKHIGRRVPVYQFRRVPLTTSEPPELCRPGKALEEGSGGAWLGHSPADPPGLSNLSSSRLWSQLGVHHPGQASRPGGGQELVHRLLLLLEFPWRCSKLQSMTFVGTARQSTRPGLVVKAWGREPSGWSGAVEGKLMITKSLRGSSTFWKELRPSRSPPFLLVLHAPQLYMTHVPLPFSPGRCRGTRWGSQRCGVPRGQAEV